MFLTNAVLERDIFEFLRDGFFFNSPVRDMSPTAYYKKGSDYIIEVKTLGINESDICVKLDGNILTVSGESKNEYNDKSFNANIRVRLEKEIVDRIETIDYTSKNGVTYVFIHMKELNEKQIKISRI